MKRAGRRREKRAHPRQSSAGQRAATLSSVVFGRVALGVLLTVTACWMAWFARYQVDDAYIVYRYARNLAQGHGFVFNPSERVEGVSCFLWTLLLAAFAWTGVHLPTVAPLLTALCGLGLVALVARRHAEVEGRRWIAARDLVPSGLLATSSAFVCWSVGALETVPYALALALATRDHAIETQTGQGRRSAAWLGLATLLRPEAPAIALALGAHRWQCFRLRPARLQVRDLAAWLATVGAFYLPLLVFRRLYFGDWLPNTYYAKVGVAPTELPLRSGAAYVANFAASLVPVPVLSGPLIALAGVAFLLAVIAYGIVKPATRPESVVVLAVLAGAIAEGGDWMVLHRFIVPALPGLAILTAQGLYRFGSLGSSAAVISGLVGLALAANGVGSAVAARDGGQGLVVNAEGYSKAHVPTALFMASHARPSDAVALMDIGMVGWYAPDLRVIDITGLTDREIARAPGGFLDKRFEVARLIERAPRFIVLVPGYTADERIAADRSFQEKYRFRFRVNHRANWNPPSEYYLHVFERSAP